MIPPQDALLVILEILGTNKGNNCGESGFCIDIGGWIRQLEFCKRKATKDVFFDNF